MVWFLMEAKNLHLRDVFKKKTLNLYIEERGSGSELCEGAQA